MNRVSSVRFLLGSAAMIASSVLIQAHTGHDNIQGLIAGCAHPFTGWDHLLAMGAVGIWAAQLGGRARWLVPAAFMGMAACGAAVGGTLVLPTFTESMILTSLLVLGLLIATATQLPVAASASLVAVFAFCHGAGHFAAQATGTITIAGVIGLLLASATLHALGYATGARSERSSTLLTRMIGAAVALTGLAFL